MRLPNLPRLAARVLHAVAVEYHRLDQPAVPGFHEQSCTGATTQVNTGQPRRAYRDAKVSPPYATGGMGFTGDPR